jgi:hypothetical protein
LSNSSIPKKQKIPFKKIASASNTKTMVKNTLQKTWAVLSRKKTEFTLLLLLDLLISIVDILSLVLLFWIIQFYIGPGENSYLSVLPRWVTDKNSIAFIARSMSLSQKPI